LRTTELRRILVVEDQALVAQTIASALEDDYEVLQSENAPEALAILNAGSVDLVLLDCLLPGGGYAEAIARCDELGIPAVLMSGDPDRLAHLETGPRPFLAKPFSIDALLETVESLTRR